MRRADYAEFSHDPALLRRAFPINPGRFFNERPRYILLHPPRVGWTIAVVLLIDPCVIAEDFGLRGRDVKGPRAAPGTEIENLVADRSFGLNRAIAPDRIDFEVAHSHSSPVGAGRVINGSFVRQVQMC